MAPSGLAVERCLIKQADIPRERRAERSEGRCGLLCGWVGPARLIWTFFFSRILNNILRAEPWDKIISSVWVICLKLDN